VIGTQADDAPNKPPTPGGRNRRWRRLPRQRRACQDRCT